MRHGQMTERNIRARRTIDPRRRKQERLTRTIVVAGVLAATVGIALIGDPAAFRPRTTSPAAAAGVAAPGVQAAVTSTTTGAPVRSSFARHPSVLANENFCTARLRVSTRMTSAKGSSHEPSFRYWCFL